MNTACLFWRERMVHLPPWPIINKYCYRNIWAARYKALQHQRLTWAFSGTSLPYLWAGGYISVFNAQCTLDLLLLFAVCCSPYLQQSRSNDLSRINLGQMVGWLEVSRWMMILPILQASRVFFYQTWNHVQPLTSQTAWFFYRGSYPVTKQEAGRQTITRGPTALFIDVLGGFNTSMPIHWSTKSKERQLKPWRRVKEEWFEVNNK